MFAVTEIIEMFLPFGTLDRLLLTTLTVVKRNVINFRSNRSNRIIYLY